jgi:hypothetical protein
MAATEHIWLTEHFKSGQSKLKYIGNIKYITGFEDYTKNVKYFEYKGKWSILLNDIYPFILIFVVCL